MPVADVDPNLRFHICNVSTGNLNDSIPRLRFLQEQYYGDFIKYNLKFVSPRLLLTYSQNVARGGTSMFVFASWNDLWKDKVMTAKRSHTH